MVLWCSTVLVFLKQWCYENIKSKKLLYPPLPKKTIHSIDIIQLYNPYVYCNLYNILYSIAL